MNAMNVILGYQDKPATPQDEMLAKMAAMMERMEAMMDPALARRMASEQVVPGPGLHLITDTLDAARSGQATSSGLITHSLFRSS